MGRLWVLLLCLLAVGTVHAAAIDAIKSIDSYGPTLLSYQNLNPGTTNESKFNLQGSFSYENWRDNTSSTVNMRHGETGLGWTCWRYNNNLSAELGYNDPYAGNATLLTACKNIVQFYAWGMTPWGALPEVNGFHPSSIVSQPTVTSVFSGDVLVDMYLENQRGGNYLGNFTRFIRKDDGTVDAYVALNDTDVQKNITIYYFNDTFLSANLSVYLVKNGTESINTGLRYTINNVTQGYLNVTNVTTGGGYVNVSIPVSQLTYGDNFVQFYKNPLWNRTDFYSIGLDTSNNGKSSLTNKTLESALILYYPFNNLSVLGDNATKAVDVSGQRNNGSISGNVTYNATGKFGAGIESDGNFDFVILTTAINLTNNQTLSFWVKENEQSDDSVIGHSTGTLNYIRMDATNNRFVVQMNSGSNMFLSYGASIDETKWNHFAFAFQQFNSTHQTVSLYTNGGYTTNSTYANNTFIFTRVTTGYTGVSTARYLNGSVDELKVYNRTLVSEEVAADAAFMSRNGDGEYLVRLNLAIDLNRTLYDVVVNNSNYIINYSTASATGPKLCNGCIGGTAVIMKTYQNVSANPLFLSSSIVATNNMIAQYVAANSTGILGEVSTQTGAHTNCYSSNYQDVSLIYLADLAGIFGWNNLTTMAQQASNVSYSQLLWNNNDLYVQTGYSCRRNTGNFFSYNSTEDLDDTLSQHPLWAMKLTNEYANFTAGLVSQMFTTYDYRSGRGIEGYWLIDLYKSWRNTSSSLPLPVNDARYYRTYGQLLNVKTLPNYYLSWGNTTVAGGVIADVFYNRTGQHLFTGNGDNTVLYGLGVLSDSSNYSNAWDRSSIMTGLSTSYPYQVRFQGNLTKRQTVINTSTYVTHYTFYDEYLVVNQTSSTATELQLWSVRNESIGVGTLPAGQPLVLNNVTFLALNFNFSYQNTSVNGTYGPTDKINASGTSFLYIVGTAPRNDTSYLADNRSRRLALPTSVSISGNIATITNNLSISLSAVQIVAATGGIVPSSPRITYPNGTSEYPAYSFDSAGTLTLNVSSLPSGTSSLLLDGAGPVLGNASVGAANIYPGDSVLLRVDALDTGNLTPVSGVFVNLTTNGLTYTTPMLLVGGSTYQATFTNTSSIGTYSLVYFANDTYGNIGSLDGGSFAIAEASGPGGGGSGGGSGGSGGGAGLVPNGSVNATNLTSRTLRSLDVSGAETVVVTGDRDAFVFGGIVLGAFVLLVLGLRGGGRG